MYTFQISFIFFFVFKKEDITKKIKIPNARSNNQYNFKRYINSNYLYSMLLLFVNLVKYHFLIFNDIF